MLGQRTIATGTARDPAVIAKAAMGTSDIVMFMTEHRDQPVDVSATPTYVARVFGATRRQFPDLDYKDGFAVQLDGESLIVSREGGGSAEISLAEWFDRQSGELVGDSALITWPQVEFELDGLRYKLLVTLFMTSASTGADGKVVYDGEKVGGDLFVESSN
jgi:hypothetical protein